MKKITLLFLFLIGTITASYGQFSENFDSGITAPAGWSVINGGSANGFIFGPGAVGSAFSQPNAAQINYNAAAHDDYLVTPQINVTLGVSDRLTYFVKNQDPNYVEAYEVTLSTTTASPASAFSVILTPEADAPDTWTQFTIDLSAYIGQSVYIGFHAVSGDKFRLLFDNIVNDTAPLTAPSCALNPTSTPNTCGNLPAVLSWAVNNNATGYKLTIGTTSGGNDILDNSDIGNQISYSIDTPVTGATYFWKVVPYNAIGDATGCTENSFTNSPGCYCASVPTSNDGAGITNVVVGINSIPNADVTYTDNTATPQNLGQGVTANLLITFGTGYTYDTNVWIDFNDDLDFDDAGELVVTGLESTADNPTDLDASFLMPATAPLGQHRLRIGAADEGQLVPDPCYSDTYGVTIDFTVNVIVPVTDTPDYIGLQFPAAATIPAGGSVDVYGQVYEAGLTNPAGQAAGIQAWVGLSSTDTNPNTWTNWTPATFNVDSGNNDEYKASIGSTLAAGTYYYAVRFTLNAGPLVYGGINTATDPDSGNFWDGTTYLSGVLTVEPAPPVEPNCDLVSTLPDDATATSVWTRPTAGGATLSAVGIDVSYHIYGPFTVDTTGSYTFDSDQNQAFDGFIFLYENSFDPNDQLTNFVAADDDGGSGSEIITDLTAGTTYYFITTAFAPGDFGDFTTTITGVGTVNCGPLAVPGFNNDNFTYYPNPVKNTLNLSYDKEISSVEVFNLLGQKVASNKVSSNSAQIDMSNLSRGAYMVKVTSNDQVKTIKVIKE